MSISSFHSFVIGANRPVGQFLTRSLSAQNFSYKGYALDQRERISVLSNGRPFFVMTPSLFHPEDYQHIPFWLEQAEDQDIPVVLLSSMAVYRAKADVLWKETDEEFAETELAGDLLALEALVRRNHRHLILRIGQGFSLDMQKRFSPTPADDISDVLQAMLKQAACCDDLWGTYHFCGVEPVSSYAFAEALLAEAGQYEDLSRVDLRSQEGATMPSVWVPPADNTHLFYTFGIKPKPWRKGLSRLVRRYYRAED